MTCHRTTFRRNPRHRETVSDASRSTTTWVALALDAPDSCTYGISATLNSGGSMTMTVFSRIKNF
jgi:hypothetical protein